MIRSLLWFGVGLFFSAAVWAETPPGPQQIVMSTADAVLGEVTQRKEQLEADATLIYPLVERKVLPHFDFEAMTRSAMGRFWRRASVGQQQQVILEFKEMLVRTYAAALLNYSGQKIEYPPTNIVAGAQQAMVPTKVAAAGGPPIPINYRLHVVDGHWLVYDVVIDGISLVTNYRSSFNRAIQIGASKASDPANRMSAGIDNLIDTLANKNDKPTG